MQKFEVLIDTLLDNILLEVLNSKTRFEGSQFNIKNVTNNSVDYKKVLSENYTLKDVCRLGQGVFYNMYTWNKRLNEKINLRSSTTLLGDKYFLGTNDEKEILNKKDSDLRLNLHADYTDDFINKIRLDNIKYLASTKLPDKVEFIMFINIDDGEFKVIDHYNRTYSTNFITKSIGDDDGLNYAIIQANKASLIDIFCLGILACQDSIYKDNLH